MPKEQTLNPKDLSLPVIHFLDKPKENNVWESMKWAVDRQSVDERIRTDSLLFWASIRMGESPEGLSRW
jgi:hypothetical protein